MYDLIPAQKQKKYSINLRQNHELDRVPRSSLSDIIDILSVLDMNQYSSILKCALHIRRSQKSRRRTFVCEN